MKAIRDWLFYRDDSPPDTDAKDLLDLRLERPLGPGDLVAITPVGTLVRWQPGAHPYGVMGDDGVIHRTGVVVR